MTAPLPASDSRAIWLRAAKGLPSARQELVLNAILIGALVSMAQGQTPMPDGFNPGAYGTVYAVAVQPDGKVLAGNVGRVNTDGTLDAGFTQGLSSVYSLAVQTDGKILAAGYFTTLGGQTRNRIGRLNADGTLDAGYAPEANSSVFSLATQPDGKVLAGGAFTYVGGQTRLYIARLNASGTTDSNFNPTANDYVYALAVQADGKILVGGYFTTVGGQARNRIARLNPDGTLDAGFHPGADNLVISLAVQADGKILVGGYFTTLGGQARNYLGRLNTDGTLDAGFSPVVSNPVRSVAIQADGSILAGGLNYIRRLNANGTLDESFDLGVSGYVDALALQADGKVLAGGDFVTLGGQARNHIGRLNNTGPAIQSLAYANSKLTWLRGGTSPEVWRTTFELSTNGLTWTNLNAGSRIAGGWQSAGVTLPPGGTIRARGHVTGGYVNGSSWFVESIIGALLLLAQSSSQTAPAGTTATFSVLAGGTEPLGYQWRKDGLPLKDDGNIAGSLTSLLSVSTVVKSDEGAYSVVVTNAGGSVTSLVATLRVIDPAITGQPVGQYREPGQSQTFSVTAGGTAPLTYQWWKDGVALVQGIGPTLTLTNLQIGDAGSYTVVVSNQYGSVVSAVAELVVNLATVDSSFNTEANSDVYALALQADGKIVVGGYFTTLGGQSRSRIGRLNADGTLDTGFNPGTSGYVETLLVQADGKILVGGYFTTLGGQARANIARLNSGGAVEAGFNPGASSDVYALALQADAKILVGGYFTTLGGQTRNYIGRLNADGTLDTGFNPGADGPVGSLLVQADGKILVGGHFTVFGGQARTDLARLNADGTMDLNFTPGANDYVYALALQADGKILIGGAFTALGGQARNRIARLNADGTLDLGFNPGANGDVYSLAVQSDGEILVGGYFTTLGGQTRYGIGRLSADGILDAGFNPQAKSGVVSIAVQADGKILVGGSFTSLGGQPRMNLARLNNAEPPPQLVQAVPTPGDVLVLTNITVTFDQGVSNVDAEDLLVNGVPASTLSSSTNLIYTFGFAQPPYGEVVVTWAPNHGIVDFHLPPKPFDGAAASSILRYTLVNPTSPRIVSQIPAANTTVTGLTSITVTFTEPVAGVDASDLLINATPAATVSSPDGITYIFAFPQPAFGAVTIRWATNHGITDLDVPPNDFDPTRLGGQWDYKLVDPAPSVALTSPINGSYALAPAVVTLRATASDSDGSIARVDFFAGAVNLGGRTNTPYTFTWSNVVQGVYALRAVATDNSGLKGTSAPVVLNVITSLPVVLVRGPYLQSGSPTGGVVRWRSDLFSDATVFYGTDPNHLSNRTVETTRTNEHIVQLTGLQPDTKYFYSVGSSAQRLAGGTNFLDGTNYWFRTSPPSGVARPTRFWVLGDSGTASPNAASVRDAYYRLAATNGPADFWLMLGDNAYGSGLDTDYQRAVFDFYPTTLRNLFLWPAIGNHESNQSFTSEDYPYLNIFSLPHNGEAGGLPSGTQKYYSFDYANIHFTCLDSMTSGRTTNTAMVQWLMNDLAATEQQWLIVFFHHPPYTKGSHDSDFETELIEIRQNIVPILEAQGVDLVLCGHSHAVERSYLLHGHYGFSAEMTNVNLKIDGGSGRTDGTGAYRKNALGQGTVYSVSGSSGQITGGSLNHPAHFVELNELGSLVIDVNGERLDVKCLGVNGDSLDYYTLVKEPRPAAPAGLVARSLYGNNVALSWEDSATNAVGFFVERSIDGIDFVRFATNGVNATTAADSGLVVNTTYFYRIRAFNAGGESVSSGVSSVTTVTVTTPPQPPSSLIVNAGEGAGLYRSHAVLYWRDNSGNEAGFLIERSSDGSASFLPLATVGANITAYVDRDLARATNYSYRVRSFNSAGDSAPSNISDGQTHPQDNVVIVGESATFHASIQGTPPISYEWRFQGSTLADATNDSLTITNAQTANAGPYSVVVTDAQGAVTNNLGWLFVLAPPVIVQQPASATNLVGSVANLQVVADGVSPLFYQWRKNGLILPGATGTGVTFGSVTLANQGDYDVLVANSLGSVTSQVARLAANRPPLAAPDRLVGFPYQSLSVAATTLLANDMDPDGDALFITGVSAVSGRGGSVTLTGQSILYSAPASFIGDDTFTYAITDGRGASSAALVTVSVTANRPPVLPAVPSLFASVRTLLVSSNLAVDPDVPTNTLSYSMDVGAPTNSRLNPSSGVFGWTPTRDQAPSTNPITLRVMDDGNPPLSNAVSFIIYVNDFIEMTAGSALLSAGESSSVPIDVFSSAGLAVLQCAFQFPGDRLANLAVDALIPQLGALDLQQPDSNTAVLTFTAAFGQTLQGTQRLAMLRFATAPDQTTAFVPLHISSLTGTRATPGLPPSLLANDGRIVVVGAQPILETLPPVGGVRQLMLYGKKNTTYTIQYSINSGITWVNRGTGKTPATNLSVALPVGNTPAPPVVYRARQ